jgi:predicted Ser/Thr protein kinase
MQCFYYFAHLSRNALPITPTPEELIIANSDFDTSFDDELNFTEDDRESDEDYSQKGTKGTQEPPRKRRRRVAVSSLQNSVLVGHGATGCVLLIPDSEIVLKHCDSYNNKRGYEMLNNEIRVYERLSRKNLDCVPRYYGHQDIFGQHFIALEYIKGVPCQWNENANLARMLNKVRKKLKNAGVTHLDLKPENVLLADDGKLKVIDFGLAVLK